MIIIVEILLEIHTFFCVTTTSSVWVEERGGYNNQGLFCRPVDQTLRYILHRALKVAQVLVKSKFPIPLGWFIFVFFLFWIRGWGAMRQLFETTLIGHQLVFKWYGQNPIHNCYQSFSRESAITGNGLLWSNNTSLKPRDKWQKWWWSDVIKGLAALAYHN